MNYLENRKRIKAEAFNKIRKIYSSNFNNYSNYQEDGSYSEQRDSMVENILNQMYTDLLINEKRK